MKKFENPTLEIENIELEDVITTSTFSCDDHKEIDPDCPFEM